MNKKVVALLAVLLALTTIGSLAIISNGGIKTSYLWNMQNQTVLNLNNKTAWLDKLSTPSVSWNFSNGEYPVSTATVIVYKQNGWTYVKWWNGTLIYKSDDGHDDDDIQKAIDVVEGLGGGTILIHSGTYNIVNTILVPKNIHIYGDGQSTVLSGSADPIFEVKTVAGNTCYASSISNMWIKGSGSNIGIKIVDSYGTVLSHLVLTNFYYCIYLGDQNYWTEATQIRDCSLEGIYGAGIILKSDGGTGGRQGTVFDNVAINLDNPNTIGIEVLNGVSLENALFLDTQIWIHSDNCTGIYINGTMASSSGLVRIENFVASPTSVYAIHLGTGADLWGTRLMVYRTGPYAFTKDIYNEAADIKHCWIIFPNMIYHGSSWGISLYDLVDNKMIAIGWYEGRQRFEVATYDAATGTWEPSSYPLTFLCPTKFTKRLDIPTTPPTTPAVGSMYFDPTTNTLYIYNGTAWVAK